MNGQPNNLPEANRRRTSPLSAKEEFRRAVHAQDSVFGGGRSAKRSANRVAFVDSSTLML